MDELGEGVGEGHFGHPFFGSVREAAAFTLVLAIRLLAPADLLFDQYRHRCRGFEFPRCVAFKGIRLSTI